VEANSDLQLAFRSSIAKQGVYIAPRTRHIYEYLQALISLTHTKKPKAALQDTALYEIYCTLSVRSSRRKKQRDLLTSGARSN
jgi:hypothetical protein